MNLWQLRSNRGWIDSNWYRRNHAKQYKYVRRLMTGSNFVKKSRRKSKHLNEWKHFCRQFLLPLQRFFVSFIFLFSEHFCLLSHFEIIKCIVKLLIATFVEIKLKKENWKSVFLAPDFELPNRYTGLPNDLDTSLWILWS